MRLVGYETFLLGSALRQHICGSGRRVVSAAVGRVRMHCRRTARADAALGLGWIRAPGRKSYATVIIGGRRSAKQFDWTSADGFLLERQVAAQVLEGRMRIAIVPNKKRERKSADTKGGVLHGTSYM